MSKKEFIGLQVPYFSFGNCFASYITSAFNYLADEGSQDDMFLFLSKCRHQSLTLDVEEVKKQFHGNAWGYKSIRMMNEDGDFLFDSEKSFKDLTKFVYENYGISIEITKYADSDEVTDVILNAMKQDNFIIVFHDEYYNSGFTELYNIKHNPHSLLIKAVDYEKQHFEVIDTNLPSSYSIPYSDVVRFIMNNSSHYLSNAYVTIYSDQFANRANYDQLLSGYLDQLIEPNYYKPFIEEFATKLRQDYEDMEFFYHAFYLMITFQIIPMIKMRAQLFSKFTGKGNKELDDTYELARILLEEWREIPINMKNKFHLETWDYTDLIHKLGLIYDREQELYQFQKKLVKYDGRGRRNG